MSVEHASYNETGPWTHFPALLLLMKRKVTESVLRVLQKRFIRFCLEHDVPHLFRYAKRPCEVSTDFHNFNAKLVLCVCVWCGVLVCKTGNDGGNVSIYPLLYLMMQQKRENISRCDSPCIRTSQVLCYNW